MLLGGGSGSLLWGSSRFLMGSLEAQLLGLVNHGLLHKIKCDVYLFQLAQRLYNGHDTDSSILAFLNL